VSTAAEPRPAELPLRGGSEGATVKLHPLLSGVASGPPAWFEGEDGRLARLHALGIGVSKDDYVEVPFVSFMLEHPAAGVVLIDTGLHPSVAVDRKQNLGRIGARLASGLKMQPEQAVPAQLRARGIEHGDVGLVVMTHLHFDHASGMSEFPAATFVMSKQEWEAATASRSWAHGYVRRQFDHAFDYRLLDFEDPAVDSYETFGRSIDLLGDGSIRAVFTPGHTLGHMAVVVRLRDREAVVAGDAIYTHRTLTDGVLPTHAEDMHLFTRSLRELQLYDDTHPDAMIIPGHDMEFWRGLAAVYE
jgi:N-acyl homoserine lactone hydrolase